MTEEEKNESIVALKEQIKAFGDRLVRIEGVVDNIHSLTISVEKLAIGVTNLGEEQKSMNARLSKIENEPRDTMRHIQRQIITALITGIVTFIFCNV